MAIRTLNKCFQMKNEEFHKVRIFLIIFIYITKYVTNHNNKNMGLKKLLVMIRNFFILLKIFQFFSFKAVIISLFREKSLRLYVLIYCQVSQIMG
jgi:hypothetical protein